MRILRRFVMFSNGSLVNSSALSAPRSTTSLLASAPGSIAALLLATAFFISGVPVARAQAGANSDPNYVALRNITLGSEAVNVSNFDLKRDAGDIAEMRFQGRALLTG